VFKEKELYVPETTVVVVHEYDDIIYTKNGKEDKI